MSAALGLARRALGNAWPNPAVGCVLVGEGGRVVGRGWTQPGGRPHAETEALRRAGAGAKGATAYVSLEPCSHHGKTPPCAEALIAAGIKRAVIALEDPDRRVSGSGMAALRNAGIPTEVGVLEAEAATLNAGYLMRLREGRPLVTLKLASTLDGRIATRRGESQWITSTTARVWAHGLRARHDAVAVGIETVLADDPQLVCRLPGMLARLPVRAVFDSNLRLPLRSKLVAGARDKPVMVVCSSLADRKRQKALRDRGVTVLAVEPDEDGRPDPQAGLRVLAEQGLTRVMVEGGAVLAASLLRAGVVDRIAWFRAPTLIGGDGLPATGSIAIDALGDAPSFVRTAIAESGPDMLETYVRPA